MSEPFDIKKFFSGLWGAANYAKVISLAIKIAIIAFVILLAMNVVDRFIPKRPPQKQTQSITTQQGGETKVNNYVYNNPPPKNKIIGAWGGLDKSRGWSINAGFGWLF